LTDAQVIADTQLWLERAVIALNLCPFAKAEHVHGRIRYVVSGATDEAQLLEELGREMLHLQASDPAQCETTLLMHPQVHTDFLLFNDFLDRADALLDHFGLEGELQIASFHPQYQFADAPADDITNYSNRAPWPTLHLLREASIERAVEAFPDAADIYERNMETLRRLGLKGWQALMAG
jgi:hypothetical protein